ncbi:MAG: peptidoglycan DD-metalloendopeptidase family protein [Pirellulales bacterium]|nr:peptidoglycan DD-metalloendopeptidase family protein [Pirellulales bacterium]
MRIIGLPILLLVLSASSSAAQDAALTKIDPLMRAVDLNVGQEQEVALADGKKAAVKLLDVQEHRDRVRGALRQVRVVVEVNGQRAELVSATYHLPITVAGVQIDCPITKGYLEGGDHWGLEADARLRLWPAGSPWIRPGTFSYPVDQRWFAGGTLMSNEIGDDERPEDKTFYYHWGLDFGGAERLVTVSAATDGIVVSAGEKVLEGEQLPSLVRPRYDVIYLRDGRGWYYRYSHLDSIDPLVLVGARVKQGQKIGALGKEGASGGWTHLHFDIVGLQPSGKHGVIDAYAFVWQVYHDQHPTEVEAVARPRQLAWAGEPVMLDGSRSWSKRGPEHIQSYEWTLSNGQTATGPKVEIRYDRAGNYSEILKVTDDQGNIDYDFARVKIAQREQPEQHPPGVHAAYWPTFGIKRGDEVTFKARSFAVDRNDGCEAWDFGDGSPAVTTQSNSSGDAHAPDGYAITAHRYREPGHYLVSVRRTNQRGQSGTDHLHVVVEP